MKSNELARVARALLTSATFSAFNTLVAGGKENTYTSNANFLKLHVAALHECLSGLLGNILELLHEWVSRSMRGQVGENKYILPAFRRYRSSQSVQAAVCRLAWLREFWPS